MLHCATMNLSHLRSDRLRPVLSSLALLTLAASSGCKSNPDPTTDPSLYGSCIPDVLEVRGPVALCPPPTTDGAVSQGVACGEAPDAGRCTFDHVADASYVQCYCTPLCNGAGAQWQCGRWAIGPLPPPELIG